MEDKTHSGASFCDLRTREIGLAGEVAVALRLEEVSYQWYPSNRITYTLLVGEAFLGVFGVVGAILSLVQIIEMGR